MNLSNFPEVVAASGPLLQGNGRRDLALTLEFRRESTAFCISTTNIHTTNVCIRLDCTLKDFRPKASFSDVLRYHRDQKFWDIFITGFQTTYIDTLLDTSDVRGCASIQATSGYRPQITVERHRNAGGLLRRFSLSNKASAPPAAMSQREDVGILDHTKP